MAAHQTIHPAEIAFTRILSPFALGILIADRIEISGLPKYLLCGIIGLIILLIAINLGYLKIKAYQYKGILGVITAITLTLTGSWCYYLNKSIFKSDSELDIKKEYLKIMVTNEPIFRKNIWRFKAAESREKNTELMVAVKVQDSAAVSIEYGDQFIIPNQTKPIPAPLNPAEFDYKLWLSRQHVCRQIFLNQHQVIKLRNNSGNPIQAYALKLRKAQVDFYRKIIRDDDCFSIATTLILGYRADLSQETFDIYSKTGTIHVLSVSGMHVGLVYIIINWALFFMKGKRWLSILKITITISLIWFYALLTGLSPSVLRSAVMLSVFILAKLLNRHSNSYNIISFAGFCLLLYEPFLIWDVGFQLSFLAVLGLIYLQPIIQKSWQPHNKWINKLWSAVAMSTAAQIATYPLSIYYFHQFPVYFLISNLFIILPSALMMYMGIFILVLRIEALGPVFEWLIRFMTTGLDQITTIPLANITGIWISQTQLILLSLALFTLIEAWKCRRKKQLFAALSLFLIFQGSLSYQKLRARQQKLIICFSLTKNYAVALISGTKATLITDLEPGQRDFNYHIKPALDQYKILKTTFKDANKTGLKPSILKKIKASLTPIN